MFLASVIILKFAFSCKNSVVDRNFYINKSLTRRPNILSYIMPSKY